MNLPLTILRVLDRVDSIPELTLIAEVNLLAPAPVTPSAIRAELHQLDASNQAVGAPHTDKGMLWAITAQGRMRLRS